MNKNRFKEEKMSAHVVFWIATIIFMEIDYQTKKIYSLLNKSNILGEESNHAKVNGESFILKTWVNIMKYIVKT